MAPEEIQNKADELFPLRIHHDGVQLLRQQAFKEGANWMAEETKSSFKTDPVNFLRVQFLRALTDEQRLSFIEKLSEVELLKKEIASLKEHIEELEKCIRSNQ